MEGVLLSVFEGVKNILHGLREGSTLVGLQGEATFSLVCKERTLSGCLQGEDTFW
jgi:hypothetical protein